MNLSVKSFGQLAVLAVALFFFSCSEETSPLGFKNPNPKFQSRYVEIPITSSVVLLDSTRTSNGDAVNDLNRLIVGKHNDPVFGDISASAVAQIYPLTNLANIDSTGSKNVDENTNLEFQSIEIRLLIDYYAYGEKSKTTQTFKIHKLTETPPSFATDTIRTTAGGQQKPVELITNRKRLYFNRSTTPYEAAAIGTASVEVDYDKFATEFADLTFDTTYVVAPLDNALGQEIFTLMNTDDFRKNIVNKPKTFMDLFKGIAIVPETSDKIIRFSLPKSSIRISYRDKVKKKNYTLDIGIGSHSLFGLVSYNNITSDRSGTALDGLTNFYQSFEPTDDKRYIQAGTGIATAIDFSKFLEFSDTIDLMLINGAEFVIKNVDEGGSYVPLKNLIVKLSDENNRYQKISYQGRASDFTKDVTNLNLYRGFVNFDRRNFYNSLSGTPFDSTLNVVNDGGAFLTLNYDKTAKSYRGNAALFFQSLFQKDEAKIPFTKAILLPYSLPPSSSVIYGLHVAGKSLDRVSFDKDDIKLRIYYTIPSVEPNQ